MKHVGSTVGGEGGKEGERTAGYVLGWVSIACDVCAEGCVAVELVFALVGLFVVDCWKKEEVVEL